MTVVSTCETCHKPVHDTDPRVTAHPPVRAADFIGGGEFDVIGKHAGYTPDPRYGHGGTWEPPKLLHLGCASRVFLAAHGLLDVVDAGAGA